MLKLIYSFLTMLVCTTAGCISDDEPTGNALGAGDVLPEFSVTMNTGEVVSTMSLNGKIGVIVFFNTGCKDCQEELPVVQQLWDYYNGNPNIVIAPIAREENFEEILEYWNKAGLSMPFSPQPNRDIYNLFASSVIPRIYIVNSQGIITASYDDSAMPSYADLVYAIENAQSID